MPLGAGFLIGPVIGGALHGPNARYREPLLFGAGMLAAGAACIGLSLKLTPTAKKPKLVTVEGVGNEDKKSIGPARGITSVLGRFDWGSRMRLYTA